MEFFFFFFLEIIVFLPLFILSSVFLYQALKRRNIFQIIIFLTCFSYTGFRIIVRIPSYLSFRKEDRQIRKYEFMPVGDTAKMEGIIAFRTGYLNQLKETLFSQSTQSDSLLDTEMSYIYLSVNTYKDNMSLYPIHMPPSAFKSLKPYLNYKQQLKDTVSYKLTITIKKTRPERWELYEIGKITNISEAPLVID